MGDVAAGIAAFAAFCFAGLAAVFWQSRRTLTQQLTTANTSVEFWRTKETAAREACVSLTAKASAVDRYTTDLGIAQDRLLKLTQACSGFESQAKRIPELELEIDGLNRRVIELTTARANLETSLLEQEKTHQDKVKALIELRGEIENNFRNIAADSLKANESSFLNLANEVFQRHKESAAFDAESKVKAVDALVAPIVQMLNTYQEQIGEMEKARQESTGAISNELKHVIQTQHSVRSETAKLVNALRAAPKTRGRWGEHTLRKVIELSGLSTYCDFTVEQTIHGEAGVIRPDVIIRLPGDRMLVVDAKTSLSAYLDAVECHDEMERDRHLDLHATQIRNHVKQLGGKSYWDGLRGTPDFVIMFVPGDNFYAAAAERDPDVFEFAAAQRVLIVTPATLIALAKAVAYGWRQEKIAENTRAVHELGRDLYRRLSAMSTHISGMGKSLSASMAKYNDFIGSFESSVLPQARRFNEMEVEGTSVPLASLVTIGTEIRVLRGGTDIVIADVTQTPATPDTAVMTEQSGD